MGKMYIENKIQVSKAIVLAKYGIMALYDEDTEKIFIIDQKQLQFDKTDGWTLIGIPEKEDRLFLIESIFLHMMIYLIKFNQLIKIEVSCESLYQMNPMKIKLKVKQHRYNMTRSKIRRAVLPNIQPRILFRERGRTI